MTELRKVNCPNCGHKHNIEMPGMKINRHFAVRKNTSGVLEFELEIPTGWSVEEWVIPSTPIIGDMIISGFISLCGAVIPFAIIAEVVGMKPEIIFPGVVTVFSIGTAMAMAFIEFMKQERLHEARGIKQAYIEASKPEVPRDEPIRMEMIAERDEAQAEKYAYKFIGNLNVSRETFEDWAEEVIAGTGLAFALWTGKGKPFSRRSYELFLSHMDSIGVAKKSESGWRLTNGGKRSLERYISQVR